MKLRTQDLERQRAKIHAAIRADPARSSRSIAREIGCSTQTVLRQRGVLASASQDETNETPHPGAQVTAPPLDNERAVTHGSRSEKLKRPIRERILADLKRQLPACNEQLLDSHAEVAAMITLLSGWTDTHGLIRDHKRGEVFNAADMLRRLITQYDKQHVVLLAMQREADHVDPARALEEAVAEIVEARNGDGAADRGDVDGVVGVDCGGADA